MRSKIKLFSIICFMTIMNSSFSQNGASKNALTHKLYYYTFSGQLSFDAIEQMKTEILNMQFVTEAKIEYKAEKGLGQIRVFTEEHYINSDSDFEFNIYNLKQLLIRYNASPNEIKSEIISK